MGVGVQKLGSTWHDWLLVLLYTLQYLEVPGYLQFVRETQVDPDEAIYRPNDLALLSCPYIIIHYSLRFVIIGIQRGQGLRCVVCMDAPILLLGCTFHLSLQFKINYIYT